MSDKEKMDELEKQVTEGLKRAYKKMVFIKKKNNRPLIVSENGKVISIPAKDIPDTTSEKRG